jgi:hypothetical protein
MAAPSRYLRAFFIALVMTLRGQKPPSPRHPELSAWTRQSALLVRAVAAAADRQGLDRPARQRLVLKIDRRDISAETILSTVEHHAAREFPSLLAQPGTFNLAAVQASNVNDRYWLSRLQTLPEFQSPALQAALRQLDAHLQAIPTAPPSS